MVVHAAKKGPSPRPGLRDRTRALLLESATQLFAKQGVDGTPIHQIAAEAGVSNGTFYNYFRTREELVEAVGLRLATQLHEQVALRQKDISDPAERMAIGCRTFILAAHRDASWAAALLRVWVSSASFAQRTASPIMSDLRAGRRRGRFVYRNEAAALSVVEGSVLASIRSVLDGDVDKDHATAVASLILRALGVAAPEADDIARRPLEPVT